MRLTNREKIFIMTSLVIVFVALYYSLFYKNIRREIRMYENEIQRDKSDLEDTSHRKDQIKKLEDSINSMLKEAKEMPLNLDKRVVQPNIIVFLEDSIKDFGMGTGIIFQEIEEHESCYIITVTLSFETSYNNLKKVISNIERAPWPLIIDDIKATNRQSDSIRSSFNWDVEAILRFLLFPQ